MEPKIVGPLTLKQFAFIAAPFLISFFLFFVLNRFVWFIMAFILAVFAILFAFVKVSGRPFWKISLYALTFFWQPKLLLWKRAVIQERIEIPAPVAVKAVAEKRSALKSVSLGVSGKIAGVSKLWQDLTTTKNPIPKREKSVPKKTISDIKEQYMVFKKMSGEREVAKRIDYR